MSLVHEARGASFTFSEKEKDKSSLLSFWKNSDKDGGDTCSLWMVQKHMEEQKSEHTCKITEKLSSLRIFQNARQKKTRPSNAGNREEMH